MFLPFNIRIRNEIIVRGVRTHRGGASARIVQAILNDTIRQQLTLEEDASGAPGFTPKLAHVRANIYFECALQPMSRRINW